MNIILLLLALWNFIVFITYGADKNRAIKNKWRVPERTLLWMAFLLGGCGAFLGMQTFRHKTKKLKFSFFVPLFLLLQIGLLLYYSDNFPVLVSIKEIWQK